MLTLADFQLVQTKLKTCLHVSETTDYHDYQHRIRLFSILFSDIESIVSIMLSHYLSLDSNVRAASDKVTQRFISVDYELADLRTSIGASSITGGLKGQVWNSLGMVRARLRNQSEYFLEEKVKELTKSNRVNGTLTGWVKVKNKGKQT